MMKVSVNDQELFTLSDTQKRVICNEIHEDVLDEDMKRRLQWVLMHKYDNCFEALKREWDPKLKGEGIDSVPTDPDSYAELIFSLPSYRSRKQRDM